MLANIYLHYVFDLWAHQWRKKQAHGDIVMVRYADDVVVGFQHRAEAERFREALVERFRKFGLELHAEKTRLIEFGRYAAERRATRGQGKPETFDFLGFRHICSRNHHGGFKLLRRTIPSRLRARVKEVYAELKARMHHPVPSTGHWLRAVVDGYYRYQGVPDNWPAMRSFRADIIRLWRRCLQRRSQKGWIRWARMTRLAEQWVPQPRLYHPWPEERLRV